MFWTSLRSFFKTIYCLLSCKKKTVLPITMECESRPRKIQRRTSSSHLSECTSWTSLPDNPPSTEGKENTSKMTPEAFKLKEACTVLFFCSRCRREIRDDQIIFCYGDSQYCGETCRTRDIYINQARMALR